jgi:hypothetical protein
MAIYFPPRVNVSTFNPENFIDIGTPDSTASAEQTLTALEAETNAITASATAQATKFADILTQPKINIALTVTGTFNVGASGVTFTINTPLSIGYYYYVLINLNFYQSGTNSGGTLFPIQGIQCFSSLTNSYAGWSSDKTSSTTFANPGVSFSFLEQGNNANPSFTLTFPQSGGYSTNPNSFTANGYINITGITASS